MGLKTVLLPGMDGTGRMLEPLVSEFDSDVETKVVRYPSDKRLSYKELETLVRAALPEAEEFVVVAESFSGPIGISLAASPPAGLKGLVMCASFARNPRPGLKWLRAATAFLPMSRLPVWLSAWFTLGRFSTPRLRALLKSALADVAPSVLNHRLRQVLDVDVSSLLPRIKVPCLYLRPTEDRLVPAAESELIANRVPDARVVEVRAPHFLLQVASREAANAISVFARSVLAGKTN